MKICIDPGHGGYDPGAVGPAKTKESTINLAVAILLSKYLASIAAVRFTRIEDQALGANLTSDLLGRVSLANNWPADLLVSIHCNSGSATAKGMEIYTTPGQGPSDKVAEAIVQEWTKLFPGGSIRKDLRDGDSDKEANFYVLRKTDMPAVLIELGFISNPQEEQMLINPAFQQKAALAIAQGIANYWGVALQNTGPNAAYNAAIYKLATKRMISNSDYWLNAANSAVKGEWMAVLLKNITGKIDLQAAIATLSKVGAITAPDYWLQNCVHGKTVNGQYVQVLIVNAVSKLGI